MRERTSFSGRSRAREVAEWVAVAVMLLLLPLGMLLLIRDMWVVEFHLTNRVEMTVAITPMGQWDVIGTWGALPQPPDSPLDLWRHRGDPGTVVLSPGESTPIRFDADDITFTHLLIETPDARVWLSPVAHRTEAGALYEEYTIESLQDLKEAPPELLPILGGETVEWSGETASVTE